MMIIRAAVSHDDAVTVAVAPLGLLIPVQARSEHEAGIVLSLAAQAFVCACPRWGLTPLQIFQVISMGNASQNTHEGDQQGGTRADTAT